MVVVRESRFPGSTNRALTTSRAIATRKLSLQQRAVQPVEHGLAATTVKKPSENSPLKRANRRRCKRKQTPQNRVIAMIGRSWEKAVEDAWLLEKQVLKDVAEGNF